MELIAGPGQDSQAHRHPACQVEGQADREGACNSGLLHRGGRCEVQRGSNAGSGHVLPGGLTPSCEDAIIVTVTIYHLYSETNHKKLLGGRCFLLNTSQDQNFGRQNYSKTMRNTSTCMIPGGKYVLIGKDVIRPMTPKEWG